MPISEFEKAQRVECQKLRLSGQVLRHDNILTFFKCTGDKDNFSHLYKAIEDTGADTWNHLFSKFDDLILSDIDTKNKYLGYFRELDRQGGLDDLATILNSMHEKNFWDAFLKIAHGADTHAADSKVSKEELLFLIESLDKPKMVTSDLIRVVNSLMTAAKKPMPEIGPAMRRLSKIDRFQEVRLKLINEMVTNFKEDDSLAVERILIPSILKSVIDVENGSQLPFIFAWLNTKQGSESVNDDAFNFDYFKKLTEFPIFTYPLWSFEKEHGKYQILHDIEVFNKLIGTEGDPIIFGCRGSALEFDFSPKFSQFLGVLATSEKSVVRNYLEGLPGELDAVDAGCSIKNDLLTGEYQFDLQNSVDKLKTLFDDEQTFTVAQFLQNEAIKSGDGNYFLRKGKSKMTSMLLEFVDLSFFGTPNLMAPTFSIIRNLPIDLFFPMGRLMDYFLSNPDNLKEVRIYGKIWEGLEPEMQLYLLNIIDQHFAADVNYEALFQFYQSVFQELPEILPAIAKSLTGDTEKTEKTYNSLYKMAFLHQGEEVLSDLRRWFSREKVLQIVKLLSGQAVPLKGFVEFQSPEGSYVILQSELSELDSQTKSCFEKFNKFTDFYQKVVNFPAECEGVYTDGFILDLYYWLSLWEKNYRESFPGKSVFDNKGLFSPESLTDNLIFLKNVDLSIEFVNDQGLTRNGIGQLAIDLGQYFNLHPEYKEDLFNLFDISIEALNSFTNDSKYFVDGEKAFFTSQVKSLAESNAEVIKGLMGEVGTLFVHYGEQTKLIWQPKKEKRSCSATYIYNYGEHKACPELETIKRRTHIIANTLLRKFKGNPRLIESFLNAFNPEKEFMIPYEGKKKKQKSFKMTIEEVFTWVFDLSSIKTEMKFHHEDTKKDFKSEVTYLQMIETNIRETGFMNGIFGSIWANAVSRTNNYDRTLKAKQVEMGLLKFATGILRHIKRRNPSKKRKYRKLKEVFDEEGLKGMSKKERKKYRELQSEIEKYEARNLEYWVPKESKWMMKNVVETYEGLKMNNHKYPDTRTFNRSETGTRSHGDFIIAYMRALVESSSDRAQNISGYKLPHDPLIALEHNGMFLNETVKLYANSNFNRWLGDRIYKNEKGFNRFLSSPEFRRVNDKLLKSLNWDEAYAFVARLGQKYGSAKNIEGNPHNRNLYTLIDDAVDGIADLDYDNLRLLEEVVGNSLVLTTYLGPGHFGKNTYLGDRYAGNTTDKGLLILERIISSWDLISPHLDLLSFDIRDLLLPLHKMTTYLREQVLTSNNGPSKGDNIVYVINEMFLVLDDLLLKEVAGSTGIDILLSKFEKDPVYWISTMQRLIETFTNLEKSGKFSDGNMDKTLIEMGRSLKSLAVSPSFDPLFFRGYLLYTLSETIDGEPNPHYHEIENLIEFFAQKNADSKSRVRIALEEIFERSLDRVSLWLEDVLKLLKLKTVSDSGSAE
ncbi:MAG: hypothetical protein HOE90_23975 [Bacteriovoracaceae bacterium]|nr:hypothetical protein [Bacteriovoracaceae bacterium]